MGEFLKIVTRWREENSNLKIDEIVVTGHSLGGDIGAEFADMLLESGDDELKQAFKVALLQNPAIQRWVTGLAKTRWEKRINNKNKYIFLTTEGDPISQLLQNYAGRANVLFFR